MSDDPKKSADTVDILINYDKTNGYGFMPPESHVGNRGTVIFTTVRTCWVWTFVKDVLVNAFNGERGDHVLVVAPVGVFIVASQYDDTLINVVGTDVNAPPPPPPDIKQEILKGTIHIGSAVHEHREKH